MMKKTAIAVAACALAATSGIAVGSTARVRQFDQFSASAIDASSSGVGAFARTGKLSRRMTAKLKKADIGPRGINSNFDAKLGGNTFLWVHDGKSIVSKAGAVPMKRSMQAETIARAAIAGNASALVVGKSSIKDAKLSDLQDNGRSVVVASFQQRVGGRDVFNRQMAVLMDKHLTPKAISGYFAPEAQVLKAKKSPGSFSLSAADAIAVAFSQMGGGRRREQSACQQDGW